MVSYNHINNNSAFGTLFLRNSIVGNKSVPSFDNYIESSTKMEKDYFDFLDNEGIHLETQEPEILVIGASTVDVEFLVNRYPKGKITAVNLTKSLLYDIQRKYENNEEIASRLKLYHADATRLEGENFRNQSFDLIYARQVDMNAFFGNDELGKEVLTGIAKEEERLVRPGGIIYHSYVKSNAVDFEDPAIYHPETIKNGDLIPLPHPYGKSRPAIFLSKAKDKVMLASDVENKLMQSLNISENIVYRSPRTRIAGKTIGITQYKNDRDQPVPFFRVGKFIVVQEKYVSQLDQDTTNYPYLIVLDADDFNARFDYQHTYSWSGSTIGILASMLAHEGEIQGASFIDAGAGRTGIHAIAAKKLGAEEIIVIERDSKMMNQLKDNLERNGIQDYRLYQKSFQDIQSLETASNPVISANLPYFGTHRVGKRKSDELKSIFNIVQNPVLAFVSGIGPYQDTDGTVAQETEEIFKENGASEIDKVSIQKDFGSETSGFVNIQSYATYIAKFDQGMVATPVSDKNLLTSLPSKKKGGIDFNPSHLDLQTQGAGTDFDVPLDPQVIQNIQTIDGFTPVIFNIAPVTNLPLLLGVADPRPSEEHISRGRENEEPASISYDRDQSPRPVDSERNQKIQQALDRLSLLN